jgi:hypothetical protein
VLWYGHPVWKTAKTPVAGFKAYAASVTLMIWNGGQIIDDTGRLTPGRHLSTVKIHSTTEIDRATVSGWLKSAQASRR